MRIDILSLFPGYFKGPFDESIIGQARKKGLLDIHLVNIRDYTVDRHHRVDDRPYGGGPGMVMMAEPIIKALESVATPQARIIYASPQGKPLNASKCRELAAYAHLVILCGHYEGIDERVLESGVVHEEISIGDYVLTNGCLPAIVIIDAVVRFIPGILGHAQAANQDSFSQEASSEDSFEHPMLDCPHYTRPEVYAGKAVPAVLISGNHQKIKEWRHAAALANTKLKRPDLLHTEDC